MFLSESTNRLTHLNLYCRNPDKGIKSILVTCIPALSVRLLKVFSRISVVRDSKSKPAIFSRAIVKCLGDQIAMRISHCNVYIKISVNAGAKIAVNIANGNPPWQVFACFLKDFIADSTYPHHSILINCILIQKQCNENSAHTLNIKINLSN